MDPNKMAEILGGFRQMPSQEIISEIERLRKEYPASAVLHMLSAKIKSDKKETDFEEAVQSAALYCNDRKKLFNYIHNIPPEIIVHQHIPEYRLDLPDSEIAIDHTSDNDLISKFLSEKPVLKLITGDEPDEGESSEDPGIISEAMAEIYVRRGQTEEAIRVFEKLSLKYPEKSTYFAARIEKIKRTN